MKNINFSFFFIIFLTCCTTVYGQEGKSSLTLEEAIALSRENIPVLAQKDYIQQIKEHKLTDLQSKWYPQLKLNAQATYQSEVTSVPIELPGLSFDALSRDQYKIVAEAQQTLYEGGRIKQLKAMQGKAAEIESLSLEPEAEKVRMKTIEVYFGILEIDALKEQIETTKTVIDAKMKKVEAAVQNGFVLKIELLALEAERIKLDQQGLELNARRSALVSILSLLTGQNLPPNLQVSLPAKPDNSVSVEDEEAKEQLLFSQRPAMQLLNLGKEQLALKTELDKLKNRPNAQAFIQAGYGKPGLNFLENKFDFFYIAGIRATWNLSNFYLPKTEAQINLLEQEKIKTQEDAFRLQNQIQEQQYQNEIQRLEILQQSDDEIIDIRQQIHKVAAVQLENGAITSDEYISKLNDEVIAKQTKALRAIQIRKQEYLIKHIAGFW